MRTINVHEAKTQLSRLLDDVRGGEEIILAKAGTPYARLVPVSPPERKLGFLSGLTGLGDLILEPLDDGVLDSFEAEP